MKHITTTFFKGLFTLLPLMLSIYVFIWFLTSVESFSREGISLFWPESWYIPGMGVMFCFVVIYAFGTVVDRPLARWLFALIEGLFRELPIIKTVYVALKDFTEYLKPGKAKNNQVVLVRWPGVAVEMVGLMTREHLRDMPAAVTKEGKVAVYFPMSYQFGGCTLFIPREWVHPTNLSVEAAMRSIITAWLPGEDKKLEQV